jgi:hypothetical protein
MTNQSTVTIGIPLLALQLYEAEGTIKTLNFNILMVLYQHQKQHPAYR